MGIVLFVSTILVVRRERCVFPAHAPASIGQTVDFSPPRRHQQLNERTVCKRDRDEGCENNNGVMVSGRLVTLVTEMEA